MEKLNDKLYNWASILDWNTKQQAFNTASMDFVYPHLALMPDAHLGKGATVGSVIPTVGAIMPAAVGVDIGCGMIAVRTQFTRGMIPDGLSLLREYIEARVPVSAGRYNDKVTKSAELRLDVLKDKAGDRLHLYDETSKKHPWEFQLGSLGSGNHFIEITVDEDGDVWLFLHSGSRGIGNQLANIHIKIAIELCKNEKLPDKDLSFLTEGTAEFAEYIADLTWSQYFARLNRDEMMDRVIESMSLYMDQPVVVQERINCHHNFTEEVIDTDGTQPADHYWLSRKGAISARANQPGLIPGSMGTASYVVTGKGNVLSFSSAPHGAGRVFSRGAAKREFTLPQLEEAMVGIEWRVSDAFLDEHPKAYKDIDQVMLDAADLVEVQHEFHQIVNVKGL